MIINLKLSLDQRRSRKDGTFPIVFRVTYQGKSRDVATGLACKKTEWDHKTENLKTNLQGNQITFQRLNEQRLKYQEKILEYERKLLDDVTSIQDIINHLKSKHSINSTVEEFWNTDIDLQEQSKRFGNARNNKSALGAIKAVKSLNIPFKKIDYNWLVSLDVLLRSKGVKPNSISVYMRALRALYNKAINSGIAEMGDYPFRRFIIKGESTTPRVATIQELQRFFAYSPEPTSPEFDAWNIGRLIFLLRGINFADLAQLTPENIKHGRLDYRRAKTHKDYSIELLPITLEIFRYYYDKNRTTLLPILTNEEYNNPACLPERIGQLRKTTNKWLKRIGDTEKIKEPLSSYVFRYSHANTCKKLGYSKDFVAESLGHSGLGVTSRYLEDYDIELIDEMNRKVVEAVSTGIVMMAKAS